VRFIDRSVEGRGETVEDHADRVVGPRVRFTSTAWSVTAWGVEGRGAVHRSERRGTR
jgi:hypothetical protein